MSSDRHVDRQLTSVSFAPRVAGDSVTDDCVSGRCVTGGMSPRSFGCGSGSVFPVIRFQVLLHVLRHRDSHVLDLQTLTGDLGLAGDGVSG